MIAAFTTFSLLLFTSIKNASCASVPSEAFLAFYEGLARKHLRESSFSLGPQWRENDGTFREVSWLRTTLQKYAEFLQFFLSFATGMFGRYACFKRSVIRSSNVLVPRRHLTLMVPQCHT